MFLLIPHISPSDIFSNPLCLFLFLEVEPHEQGKEEEENNVKD